MNWNDKTIIPERPSAPTQTKEGELCKIVEIIRTECGWLNGWNTDVGTQIKSCEKAAGQILASLSSPAPQAAEKEGAWVQTAERAPTEQDGDLKGDVFVGWAGRGYAVSVHSVIHQPQAYPFWMPIPALPVPKGSNPNVSSVSGDSPSSVSSPAVEEAQEDARPKIVMQENCMGDEVPRIVSCQMCGAMLLENGECSNPMCVRY